MNDDRPPSLSFVKPGRKRAAAAQPAIALPAEPQAPAAKEISAGVMRLYVALVFIGIAAALSTKVAVGS